MVTENLWHISNCDGNTIFGQNELISNGRNDCLTKIHLIKLYLYQNLDEIKSIISPSHFLVAHT